jgi:hypothetical protein
MPFRRGPESGSLIVELVTCTSARHAEMQLRHLASRHFNSLFQQIYCCTRNASFTPQHDVLLPVFLPSQNRAPSTTVFFVLLLHRRWHTRLSIM